MAHEFETSDQIIKLQQRALFNIPQQRGWVGRHMDEHSIGLSASDFFSLKSVFYIVDKMTIVKFKSDYVVPNSTPACDSSFMTFK